MGIDGTTLGSTLAVVDWKRSLLETRDYGPFGRVIEHTGDLGLKHQFTGQPSDDTTGLQNYGARMYDARWARFLTPDERIQSFDSQGLNRYSYVSNQPTSMIDPGGEFALGFGGGFGGIGGMSGMSSFGSIGSTGQLPQAASSQGIMSSGPGWPCGDDVCPGDPPLNLLGTEFGELYKAIAQEEEGSQGGSGVGDAAQLGFEALWDVVKEGLSGQAGIGAGYHLKDFKIGPLKAGGGVIFGSGGVGADSEGLFVWGESTLDVQFSAGRYGGRAYLWDVDIGSRGVENIDVFGVESPTWDWSVGVGVTWTPYSFEVGYDLQPLIDYVKPE